MALRTRREEPATESRPTRNERVRDAQGLLARFWGGVRAPDIGEVAAALRKLEPADRELLGASVPFGTGTSGARCEQLRALFAGLAKEAR